MAGPLGVRDRIRSGELRGADLLAWLAAHEPGERDVALEQLLGIARYDGDGSPPGPDLIGYIPSGVAPIVQAVLDAPVTPDDVFVDLGAGLGKVAIAVHLLSGARVLGVELDGSLVERARVCAGELGLGDVSFVAADAREADVSCGTVFFMYLPFTGAALESVMLRLRAVATRRAIVVCALGIDLRAFDWLEARETESFWLSIYDSRCPGATPRPPRPALALRPFGEDVARERRSALLGGGSG